MKTIMKTMKMRPEWSCIAGLLLMPVSIFSQINSLDSLRAEIEAIKEEMRRQKLSQVMPELTFESYAGMGPAASKVYYAQKGLSIAGYGDVFYSRYLNQSKNAIGDALRFVPYIGYKVSDKIVINSELEIEHAGIGNVTTRVPEVYTEFVYTDFLLNRHFNFRTGLILLPISITNEFHEPTVYNGVFRPEVEQTLVPTVWRDLGLMAYGDITRGFTYKISLTNGLRTDPVKDWIKEGRQRGAKANMNEIAGTFRINYEGISGLTIGSALYYGGASAGEGGKNKPTYAEKALYTIFVSDMQYQAHNWNIKAMYVAGMASGDSTYKAVKGRSAQVEGFYFQAGYNIWPWLSERPDQLLFPYLRYEQYDLHKKVFIGEQDKNKWNAVFVSGINFYPHPQIVFKADYMIRSKTVNKFEPDEKTQLNVGLGFIF